MAEAPTGADQPPRNRLNLLLSHAASHSHLWADRLEPMLAPMGVLAHRAADARAATRVIETTPIHLAVVDLAIPLEETNPLAEAGWKVLELLAASQATARPPMVVIRRARSAREQAQEMNAALKLGAFAVVDPPKQPSDLELLLEVLRRALTRHYQGRWPTT